MAASDDARTLVIVGPTASGKSALGLELARRHPGTDIFSVDSMQVYRGMDIGTAKPSKAEQQEVPHHLIDLVHAGDGFGVVDFQQAFVQAIALVASRDRVPLLIGGTGLYLRAVVDGLVPPPRFPAIVEELEMEPDTEALHRRLDGLDRLAASRMEPTNRRRVIRALEVTLGTGSPFSSHGPGLDVYSEVPFRLVGIEIDRDEMDARIDVRYGEQMDSGFLAEVEALLDGPRGWSKTAAQALGYKELALHLKGELTLSDALALAKQRTRRFARRQQRWFRRDPRIEWLPAAGGPAAVADLIEA